MKRILVVDDEVQILKALSRMFLETDYEVVTADNSMDALKLMEEKEIHMVISDMRMPSLDGYKLLTMVKEKYPKIIRVILSGYADEKPLFKALLHNLAKLYVFKPWNNNEFLENVNKLFEDDTVLNSIELTDMIKNMGCCSDIPENCNKLISLIEEENIDAVIKELEDDPILSKLLIQVAQSAVYGVMPNKVKQAAIYMGLHNLKCFIHFACVASVTKQTEDIEDKPELLWKHAYLTNRIFLFLYEAFLHKQPPESAMFAGLLHNIGLILLSRSRKQNGSLKKPHLTSNDYIELENDEYVANHQVVGAYFLDQWDLPFPIYEVALYHHNPLAPAVIFHELVCAVHIAEAYAWKALSGDKYVPVKPEVFEKLGITKEEFEKKLARYLK